MLLLLVKKLNNEFEHTLLIINLDGFVKSPYLVIPAKAGIQNYLILLDPGLRRGDAIREIPTFYETINLDDFVKSPYIVIPAKAGIQNYLILLDPGLRRGDAIRKISTFYEAVNL